VLFVGLSVVDKLRTVHGTKYIKFKVELYLHPTNKFMACTRTI